MTNLVCFLGFVVSSGEGDNEFTGSKIKMHFLIIVNAIVCTAVRFMLYMYMKCKKGLRSAAECCGWGNLEEDARLR